MRPDSCLELFDHLALRYISRKIKVDAMNIDRITALSWAAWIGDEAIVRLLLKRKADINAKGKGKTALQRAAARGHETVVRLLLEHKRDVTIDYNRPTALRIAAAHGHETVVRLLLQNGADLNAKNNGEKTALHLAARCRNETVLST